MASVNLRAEAQRFLAADSIGAAYAPIGSALVNSIRIIKIWNWTDALLQFSFEGGIDHFVIPPFTGEVLDVSSNKNNEDESWYAQAGTVISVKRIETPTGTSPEGVYIAAYYAPF